MPLGCLGNVKVLGFSLFGYFIEAKAALSVIQSESHQEVQWKLDQSSMHPTLPATTLNHAHAVMNDAQPSYQMSWSLY